MTKSESIVKKHFLDKGYTVLHSGYPDFLCYNKKLNLLKFVEVKTRGSIMKKNQKKVHSIFKKFGLDIEVIRTSGDTILDKIPPRLSTKLSKSGRLGWKTRLKKAEDMEAKHSQPMSYNGHILSWKTNSAYAGYYCLKCDRHAGNRIEDFERKCKGRKT